MDIRIIELVAMLGAFFGFFGSIMAFIIAYDEYKRHFREKSKPIWMALEMAVLAFLVLVALSVIAGFVLSQAFANQVTP
jgi:ABC-type transporter Mla maintaining outer membrane lipid asymmetry permease subunit MlaE